MAAAEEPHEVSQVRCCQEVNRMYQSGFNEHDPILGFEGSPGFNGSMAKSRHEVTELPPTLLSGQDRLHGFWSNLCTLGYLHPLPPNWGRCDWVRQPDHEMFSWCCRRVMSHRPSLSVVMCPGQVVRA